MRGSLLMLGLALASTAMAADCDPECDGPTEWSKFTSITLRAADALIDRYLKHPGGLA